MQFDLIFRNQDTGSEMKIDEIFMTPITEPLIFVYPKHGLHEIYALVLEEKFKAVGVCAIITGDALRILQVKTYDP